MFYSIIAGCSLWLLSNRHTYHWMVVVLINLFRLQMEFCFISSVSPLSSVVQSATALIQLLSIDYYFGLEGCTRRGRKEQLSEDLKLVWWSRREDVVGVGHELCNDRDIMKVAWRWSCSSLAKSSIIIINWTSLRSGQRSIGEFIWTEQILFAPFVAA